MANVYEQFETDKKTESEGVVLDYGDFSIRIARAGGSNVKFNKIINKLTKPYKRALETENLDAKIIQKITMEAYSEAIILGWDGVTNRDGKNIEFNKENCLKILKDLPDLFLDIQKQANNFDLFRKSIREEQLGN